MPTFMPIPEGAKEQYGTFQQAIENALSKAWLGSQMTQKPFGEFAAGMLGYPQDFNQAIMSGLSNQVFPSLIRQPEIPNPEWITAAIKKFGVTDNPYQAGYIVPSGKMLNFGGVGKWARNIDHVEVNRLIPEVGEFPKNPEWWGNPAGPDKFTDITNSVRMSIMPQGGPLWVSMSKPPNKYQLQTIKEALPYVKKQHPYQPSLIVDIVNMTESTRPRMTANEFDNFRDFTRWLESIFGE